MSEATVERIWICKIGGMAADLPSGSDLPMRKAVEQAYHEITGLEAEFNFSGWGGELTEPERAAHENRMPSKEHHNRWLAQQAAPDMQEALINTLALASHEWGYLDKHANVVFDQARAALAKSRGEP